MQLHEMQWLVRESSDCKVQTFSPADGRVMYSFLLCNEIVRSVHITSYLIDGSDEVLTGTIRGEDAVNLYKVVTKAAGTD